MTGRHRVWDGSDEVEVDVPVSGGENVMVPVIRAIVHPPGDPRTVLLQRRDIPDESVRGRLEIPGGRWRSGEDPADAIRREVAEETGLTVTRVRGVSGHAIDDARLIAAIEPLVVVAGVAGAFPAAHIVVVAEAAGALRAEDGETSDVRWWPLDEILDLLGEDPDAFIPSSAVALRTYGDHVG